MTRISDAPPIRLTFDSGTLLITGGPDAGAGDAIARSGVTDLKWDHRVGAWRCNAIRYGAVRLTLRQRGGPRFQDDVPVPAMVHWPRLNLPTLRSEQSQALAAWHHHGCRGQVIMPTGTGKTEVALAAMARTQTATLIVAPIRDLMYQWHRRIRNGLGYDAGILGDNVCRIQPVTVTTYDSAYVHMPRIGARFGLIVFDEAHHLPGRCRREAALFCTAAKRLGLTATPQRSDGRHVDLDDLIGPVVYRMAMSSARGRALADYRIVRIPVALSDAEQRTYDQASRMVRFFISARRRERKGYTWTDLCAESGSDPAARRAQKAYFLKQSIEDRAVEKLRVLEDLFRLHNGDRVVVFAGSNAMAMEVSKRFLVPTLLSHCRKHERQAVLDGFANGRFPVVVANRVLDEGVDIPEAKIAVVVGGQASTRQAQQRLGRVLRRCGDKMATLYEVVCEDTKEVERSRKRRRSDAYQRSFHHAL